MFGFDKIDAHAAKVRKMADTLGVDLTEEMQAGRLTPGEFDATVERCLGCIETGACQQFLELSAEAGADAAPLYCRNKHQLEAMRAR